jgi:hypothetical protein
MSWNHAIEFLWLRVRESYNKPVILSFDADYSFIQRELCT